jgi:hypothetical protein
LWVLQLAIQSLAIDLQNRCRVALQNRCRVALVAINRLNFGGYLISRKETAAPWPPFLFFG